MLGALLLWYVTLDDPANRGVPLYPSPTVIRMVLEASPTVRQQMLDSAIRAGLHSPAHECIDIHDDVAWIGGVCILRGRAIGRRIPGDPAWK